MNALLAQLAPVIGGEVSDGRLKGAYREYGVEAWPHSGYPIKVIGHNTTGDVEPKAVNMLRLTLLRVAGSQSWRCQSSASSYLEDFVSHFTSGRLLKGFKPGEFKFEGVDLVQDAGERRGEKLVKWLGVPTAANADPELQERLVAAGLLKELDILRLGGHPYLPKVQFLPSARELTEHGYLRSPAFGRIQPEVDERLRAAGLADYRSVIEAKMHEIEEQSPGRLHLDVEAGKDKVPASEQFRELLEHAGRIAEINAEANGPPELR